MYMYLYITQDQCAGEVQVCSIKYCTQMFGTVINIKYRLIPLLSPARLDYSLANNPFSTDNSFRGHWKMNCYYVSCVSWYLIEYLI